MDVWKVDSLLAHPWVAFIRQPAGRLLTVIELHTLGWMNKKLILIQTRRRLVLALLQATRSTTIRLLVFSSRSTWMEIWMYEKVIHSLFADPWLAFSPGRFLNASEWIYSFGWMNNKLLFIQTCRRLLPLLQPTSRPSAICVPSSLSLSHTHAWLQRRFRLFLSVFSSRGIYLELLVSGLRHSATFEPGIVPYCGVFCLCWGSVGFAASARGRLPMSSKTFWLSNQNSLPEYLSSQSRFRKLHKSILGNFSFSFSLLFSVLVRYCQCLLLSFQ